MNLKESDKITEDLENDLSMIGAAPGAINQIETSYMVRLFYKNFIEHLQKFYKNFTKRIQDYLEDANLRINESAYAVSAWVYAYDGLSPGPNFFEENIKKSIMKPASEAVAQRTLPVLQKFLEENTQNHEDTEMPMSLEQLGITISTEGIFLENL